MCDYMYAHAGPDLSNYIKVEQGRKCTRLPQYLDSVACTLADLHARWAGADRGESLQISAGAVHTSHAGALQVAQQRGTPGTL